MVEYEKINKIGGLYHLPVSIKMCCNKLYTDLYLNRFNLPDDLAVVLK